MRWWIGFGNPRDVELTHFLILEYHFATKYFHLYLQWLKY